MALHDVAVQLILDRILDHMLRTRVAPSEADFLPTDDTFPCLSNPGIELLARANLHVTMDGGTVLLHPPYFARGLRDVFAEKRTNIHVACRRDERSIVAYASMDDGFWGVWCLHVRHGATLNLLRAELELRHVPSAESQMVVWTLVPNYFVGVFRDQVPHNSVDSSCVRDVP